VFATVLKTKVVSCLVDNACTSFHMQRAKCRTVLLLAFTVVEAYVFHYIPTSLPPVTYTSIVSQARRRRTEKSGLRDQLLRVL